MIWKENHNSAIAEVTSLLCQMNMKRKKLLIVKITMSKETNKPYEMLRLIFLFVASLESTSFSIDIVEILSDLKMASPFLKRRTKTQSMVKC